MVTSSRPHNRLLQALPADEYARLESAVSPVELVRGNIIAEPEERFGSVIFPEFGVVSSVTILEDGRVAEAATIGNEGVVGLPVFLGGGPAGTRFMTQVAGRGVQLSTAAMAERLPELPMLISLAGRYATALIAQLSQTAACNALHPVNERCARWLLTTHDRMQRTESYPLTQEFLSMMLGVHRPTVNVAARMLQAAGLISYSRGQVRILDREGLESAACECYAVINDRYAAIFHELA